MRKWLRGRLIRLVNWICPPEVTEQQGVVLETSNGDLYRITMPPERRESRGWN